MKTKALLFTLSTATLLGLNACSTETSDMDKLNWIVGTWTSQNEEGTLYEVWEQVGDTSYIGHAYAISTEGDTTFSENARIAIINGSITYSVTVNNESSTDFTLVDMQKQAVFENIQHDYPQRIIYERISSDSLFARIEGIVDGQEQSEDFRYRKSSKN